MEDLFNRMEACGRLVRLDPDVRPTMYRCATVSRPELEQLRRVKNVVRLGRVQCIDAAQIVLDQGAVATTPDTLHVDCSADGLMTRAATPVFNGRQVTLQSVRTCQQVFSAAFIAHVESAYADEAHRNALCTPIPHPDTDLDFLRTTIADGANEARWAADAGLQAWLDHSRLNWIRDLGPQLPTEPDARAAARRTRQSVLDAMSAKLAGLMAGTDARR